MIKLGTQGLRCSNLQREIGAESEDEEALERRGF